MPRSLPLRLVAAAVVIGCWLAAPVAQDLALPLKPASVRFAVFGDNGTGEKQQYDLAKDDRVHEKFRSRSSS
jgi:hypothetical protein